ncbi:unnamed protein product [Strongylus vulgaris]|uniref:CBS domain-containing protein n=1 Tax=Strongylus vulgaris TaxID=40348 RepID=A0A3P7JWS3_STRVU|nr:unnamed protein product [Strongylus vulgaris]
MNLISCTPISSSSRNVIRQWQVTIKSLYSLMTCQCAKHFMRLFLIVTTRTGLIADSNTMHLSGVLSITDFTMILMMLWKFRENIEEMKGTPLSHRDFNGMDIANMKIKSIFHAVELLSKYRIHRLPVLDKHSGDCAFILTHRRVLHYIWKYCSSLLRPDYMCECACDLKVGTYTGIHYATQEMSLLEVLDMMIDNGISGVPIVQESTMKVIVLSICDKSVCLKMNWKARNKC